MMMMMCLYVGPCLELSLLTIFLILCYVIVYYGKVGCICKIGGFHSGDYEEYRLLGCDAV
jgi:hypothetical protein